MRRFYFLSNCVAEISIYTSSTAREKNGLLLAHDSCLVCTYRTTSSGRNAVTGSAMQEKNLYDINIKIDMPLIQLDILKKYSTYKAILCHYSRQ